MMPDDLKELLRAFNDHGVKYVIVGGYAFGVHAEPRATKDLDVFIGSDEQNAIAVFRALGQYGAPRRPNTGWTLWMVRPSRSANPRLGLTSCSTLMVSLSQRPGRTASRDSSMAKSKPQSFAGVDLIRNKIATGREQDILDAKKLRSASSNDPK